MHAPWSALLASIAIHILWGGQTVAVKYSLPAFPPLWNALLRFVLAVGFLFILCRLRRVSLRPPGKETWLLLWGQSWLFLVQIGTMNWGIQLSTAAMSSILIGAHPLFAALTSHFLLARDPMTRRRSLGLGLAFGGMAFALWARHSQGLAQGMEALRWGDPILLFSSALLGGRIITGARLSESMAPECMVFWQMLLALPWFLAGALLTERIAWQQVDANALLGIAYQGFIIAGLNFTISAHLMKRYQPSIMSSFGFLAPVAGVFLSSLLLGETLHSGLLIGMAGVGGGLLLITRSGR